MAVGSSPVVDEVPAETTRRYRRLRALNVLAGVLLVAEAVFMLLAGNDLALPVTASYLRNDPAAVTGATMPQVVFLLRIGPAVAFFLALAALDHLLVAAPSVHRWPAVSPGDRGHHEIRARASFRPHGTAAQRRRRPKPALG